MLARFLMHFHIRFAQTDHWKLVPLLVADVMFSDSDLWIVMRSVNIALIIEERCAVNFECFMYSSSSLSVKALESGVTGQTELKPPRVLMRLMCESRFTSSQGKLDACCIKHK